MDHLSVHNLRKEFVSRGRTEVAVDGTHLAVLEGEFVSLLGPSGCGKTTTLRCIAGLEQPTSGTIHIAGVDRTRTPPQHRNIGMCFQEATVYPHMSLRRNLSYPLKLGGVNEPERDRRVREMAAVLKLEALLDKLPGQLSGGQRQRAALGRALIRRPTLFLLDEPMSNLDAKLKVEMRKELKTITNLFRTTTLYVTHDQEEAMALSDRICVMNQGRIEQFANPETIYRAPASTFVATFIGVPAMNLIECRCDDGALYATAHQTPSRPVIGHLDRLGIGSNGSLTVGFRPEDVRLDGLAEEGSFHGRVILAEVLGERTIIHLTSDFGEIRATVYGVSRHHVGDLVRFRFDESTIHLFDRSGARIEAPAVAKPPADQRVVSRS